MVDEALRLIQEIQQIKTQYEAEVGKGRRVWPRSIKERAARLDELGVAAKAVANQSGISYETLLVWRHHRRHKIEKFHEVVVGAKLSSPAPEMKSASVECVSKIVTVTVPNFEMLQSTAIVRLTTPGGFIVEGLDAAGIARLIGSLSGSGGGHAS